MVRTLPRAYFAQLAGDPEIAAARVVPALEPADLVRFRAIVEAKRPLEPVEFVELTARVTSGEICATLIREGEASWRLCSIREARRRATRLSRRAA